jgi:uncharacterized small protein (DUF1192 family)
MHAPILACKPRLRGTKPQRTSTARLALGYARREMPMCEEVTLVDLDDLMPAKKPSGVTIGESLETLSVAELEKRIKDLEFEIERVRLELDKKRKHEAAARSLFKS